MGRVSKMPANVLINLGCAQSAKRIEGKARVEFAFITDDQVDGIIFKFPAWFMAGAFCMTRPKVCPKCRHTPCAVGKIKAGSYSKAYIPFKIRLLALTGDDN